MPKLVDRDPDPEPLEVLEPPGGGLEIAHQGRLGDLERERLRVEATRLEGLTDVVDESVALELAARDVDRNRQLGAASAPGGHLGTGVVEDPAPDVDDLTAGLQQRDEFVGLDLAQGGVLPTNERFDADRGEVVEVVDRLVDEPELVTGERRAEVELEFVAALSVTLELGLEDLAAVLPGGFCLVERDIRVA